jgi:arsenate reductase
MMYLYLSLYIKKATVKQRVRGIPAAAALGRLLLHLISFLGVRSWPDQPIVTIYHNPACGTSRNTLALIRNAGVEPTVVEYLKTPPDRATLKDLIKRMGMRPRELLREKGTPYAELDLGADRWTDEQLIDQMLAHPILINRPIVVTPWGVRLCRPAETLLDLLQVPGSQNSKPSMDQETSR